jgi:hypothetical protein
MRFLSRDDLSRIARADATVLRILYGKFAMLEEIEVICQRTPAGSIALSIFALLSALGIGTIVKEMAFVLGAHVANWVGNDFEQTGMTPQGNLFSDVRSSDGTWCRSGLRGGQIISEWTDLNGECHRIVFEIVEGLSAGERASVFSRLAPQSHPRRPHTRYEI